MADDELWHVRISDTEVKQLTLEQIDDLYRLDVIDADTQLWQDGMDEWLPLRVVAGQSQVLAIDAESVRTLWSAAETFYSIAADAERLLLLRATELSVDWQWLEPSGAAAEAGQAALPVPIEYAFARLSRGAAYALVLEQGRPELGRLGGDGWLSIAKANSSIAGPLLVGDSASFCNAQNLAGIHMAMKTGMMAAETIVDAIAKQDFSSKTLGGYAERYRRSWAYDEHYQARNFAPSVQKGVPFFFLNEPLRTILSNGRGLMDNMSIDAGHTHMRKLWELPEGDGERDP